MKNFIKSQKDKYLNLWLDTAENIDFLPKYDKSYKKQREKQLGDALVSLLNYFKKNKIDKNNKDQYKTELKCFIRKEMKSSLELEGSQLEYVLFNDLLDITDDFIVEAKRFSKDSVFSDIYQAIRNVWIMNILQLVADIDIEYTPSIFAYSMLYPYSDNFLDDKSITNKEKKEFNQRLFKRLKGQEISAKNSLEKDVFDLIGMIESEYDRKLFPKIYDSIIAIYNAQCRSIEQQSKSLNNNELLDISIEKGGTSVLADGFLVCGNMSDAMASFTMGFGFVLQLVDDLQDIKSDRQSGSMTLFSQYCSKSELEKMTRKLLALVYKAFGLSFCTSPYTADIKKLMCDNCILIIIDAIAAQKNLFSNKFLKDIEEFSPVRLKFLIKARKRFKLNTKNIDFNDLI